MPKKPLHKGTLKGLELAEQVTKFSPTANLTPFRWLSDLDRFWG